MSSSLLIILTSRPSIDTSLQDDARFSFGEHFTEEDTIGHAITGFGVAEVIKSKNEKYLVSSIVLSSSIAWEDQARRCLSPLLQGEAVPDGIDTYIGLVGEEMLDVALEKFKDGGQIIVIRSPSIANGGAPHPTKIFFLAAMVALKINGFTVFHHIGKFVEVWEEFQPLV
ncbi:hypothetical protein BGW38_007046 [Lunasporangiospora selenospora]|uniref:Uncharacterized protein n=1 Tax=Lunasporangiospora selenospora TaxID=979761 RepID=A0A9P6FYQ2_9FUNG|nr:hypothetical protein BGW38_007046 [Lunasporangiospora selenospora]